MIAKTITKRMEIVIGIQLCLISLMNFDYKENGGKRALLVNQKHQCHVSQRGEQDCHTNNKKNGDYYKYRSLSHLMDEFGYKENGRKNAFLANPKHQYRVSQCGEQDCQANNKKSGDYYKYPCLSPSSNKL